MQKNKQLGINNKKQTITNNHKQLEKTTYFFLKQNKKQ